jgi:hypothetical protein
MKRQRFRKKAKISTGKPLGGRVNLAALAATIALGRGAILLAQTVGPEIVIRDDSLGGVVETLAAAFEPGAAYVAWMDTRNEPSFGGDIYLQKLSADGAPAWTANGVVVSAAEGQQSFPSVISDGSGGAIVAWLDRAQWVIMAQRVAASGETQWTLNGQVVGAASSQALVQPLLHRGSDGGFLVTWWQSGVASVPEDSFPALAQKLAADGAPLWDPEPPDATDTWGSGIVVLNGITRGRSVSDGANGLIVMGKIRQGGGFRFQRVQENQLLAWNNAVDFTAALSDSLLFNFAADGAGGMVVAYIDGSSVRAIRVTHGGTLPWDASGVTLTASNIVTSQPPQIAGDGQGGAFVTWISSSPRAARAQHIAANGALSWPAEGVEVPDESIGAEQDAAIAADGFGGLYLVFEMLDLRGHRLNSAGAVQWFESGSAGLDLMDGFQPLIGAASDGAVVFYLGGSGSTGEIHGRKIVVSQSSSFQLTDIGFLPSGELTLRLNGGSLGTAYDIRRAPALAAPVANTAWTIVGTVQAGETWTDPNPPITGAFYSAGETTP